MSDTSAPRRRIEGVSALSRMRSTATAASGLSVPEAGPAREQAVTSDHSEEQRITTGGQATDLQEIRARLSGYTTAGFASLAKSTYKATAHLEDEASFSDFLQAAVDREIKRRQELYNDGRPFVASTSRLKAGRPLRS